MPKEARREEYITPSHSIHELKNGMAYYNYNGTHYRVFNSYEDALEFATYGGEGVTVVADFDSEEDLDRFLEGTEKSSVENNRDAAMKTIDTEIWVPNPEKEHFLQYQGQRLVSDVFSELESQVKERFKDDDEDVVFEYIFLDREFEDAKSLFPKGHICVFVLPGRNEAFRVNLCVLNTDGGYEQIASCKVWSHEGAHEVCKYIYKLFYGERGAGI
ncbi:hypothetical protein [Aquamicrobium sp.]|uniref:hypothetical protein n=1 Tax=Aquamicrobium sp. TaxID=1872579 RepID=UPI00258DE994|nr:hypothetical protein [Aquamicrobium sp.]MCK9552335.1 hypothetical protein [Aquamicrobium sp.]